MRLDKYLAVTGFGSRKEVKKLIKQKVVMINEEIVTSDKFQLDETNDVVSVNGEKAAYQKYFYYMLNKPAGTITATKDCFQTTVMDLLKPVWRADLFPVGRLDKDTEGLLLITNDGELAHNLLSPKKHIEKEYYVEVSGIITEEDCQRFKDGINLEDDGITLPADLRIVSADNEKQVSKITLIIMEGKFHQVKRMIQAVGKKVTYLKRIRMGTLSLDPQLTKGCYRELTEEEVNQLSSAERN